MEILGLNSTAPLFETLAENLSFTSYHLEQNFSKYRQQYKVTYFPPCQDTCLLVYIEVKFSFFFFF